MVGLQESRSRGISYVCHPGHAPNARSYVWVNGQYSEDFGVGVGVHQGSVLIFTLMTCCSLQRSVGEEGWRGKYMRKTKFLVSDEGHNVLKIWQVPLYCLLLWCWQQLHPVLTVPIDGQSVTEVDVDGTMLGVEATFCYLGDMLCSCCVAWENYENPCLSLPPNTTHLDNVARCTRPAFARLCSMVEKRGYQITPNCTDSGTVTEPWSVGSVASKTQTDHPQLHYNWMCEEWCQ